MKKKSGDLVSNRKARHDYEILETYEAGLVLKGTEVKSLRDGGGSLQEAYVKVLKGEVWLIGANIAQYRFGNLHNHEERRDRKLLLHKREIAKVEVAVQLKGLTLVPLNLHFNKGRIKITFGIGKGKKLADKRSALKERQQNIEIQRTIRDINR
ncbi:MAG: SsrA-binding protein [Chlamydiales bacterium]|jgi:SsrA-binding protein